MSLHCGFLLWLIIVKADQWLKLSLMFPLPASIFWLKSVVVRTISNANVVTYWKMPVSVTLVCMDGLAELIFKLAGLIYRLAGLIVRFAGPAMGLAARVARLAESLAGISASLRNISLMLALSANRE